MRTSKIKKIIAGTARIFGTDGRTTYSSNYDGYRQMSREYKPCRKYSYVSVSFSTDPGEIMRVDGKSAFWF